MDCLLIVNVSCLDKMTFHYILRIIWAYVLGLGIK